MKIGNRPTVWRHSRWEQGLVVPAIPGDLDSKLVLLFKDGGCYDIDPSLVVKENLTPEMADAYQVFSRRREIMLNSVMFLPPDDPLRRVCDECITAMDALFTLVKKNL